MKVPQDRHCAKNDGQGNKCLHNIFTLIVTLLVKVLEGYLVEENFGEFIGIAKFINIYPHQSFVLYDIGLSGTTILQYIATLKYY